MGSSLYSKREEAILKNQYQMSDDHGNKNSATVSYSMVLWIF